MNYNNYENYETPKRYKRIELREAIEDLFVKGLTLNVTDLEENNNKAIPNWSPNNLRRIIISPNAFIFQWFTTGDGSKNNTLFTYETIKDEDLMKSYQYFVTESDDVRLLSNLMKKVRAFSNLEEIIIFTNYIDDNFEEKGYDESFSIPVDFVTKLNRNNFNRLKQITYVNNNVNALNYFKIEDVRETLKNATTFFDNDKVLSILNVKGLSNQVEVEDVNSRDWYKRLYLRPHYYELDERNKNLHKALLRASIDIHNEQTITNQVEQEKNDVIETIDAEESINDLLSEGMGDLVYELINNTIYWYFHLTENNKLLGRMILIDKKFSNEVKDFLISKNINKNLVENFYDDSADLTDDITFSNEVRSVLISVLSSNIGSPFVNEDIKKLIHLNDSGEVKGFLDTFEGIYTKLTEEKTLTQKFLPLDLTDEYNLNNLYFQAVLNELGLKNGVDNLYQEFIKYQIYKYNLFTDNEDTLDINKSLQKLNYTYVFMDMISFIITNNENIREEALNNLERVKSLNKYDIFKNEDDLVKLLSIYILTYMSAFEVNSAEQLQFDSTWVSLQSFETLEEAVSRIFDKVVVLEFLQIELTNLLLPDFIKLLEVIESDDNLKFALNSKLNITGLIDSIGFIETIGYKLTEKDKTYIKMSKLVTLNENKTSISDIKNILVKIFL